MESNKNIFEKVTVTTLDIVRAAGSLGLELFRMHQLSPVSDHKGDHPFDTELYGAPNQMVFEVQDD